MYSSLENIRLVEYDRTASTTTTPYFRTYAISSTSPTRPNHEHRGHSVHKESELPAGREGVGIAPGHIGRDIPANGGGSAHIAHARVAWYGCCVGIGAVVAWRARHLSPGASRTVAPSRARGLRAEGGAVGAGRARRGRDSIGCSTEGTKGARRFVEAGWTEAPHRTVTARGPCTSSIGVLSLCAIGANGGAGVCGVLTSGTGLDGAGHHRHRKQRQQPQTAHARGGLPRRIYTCAPCIARYMHSEVTRRASATQCVSSFPY